MVKVIERDTVRQKIDDGATVVEALPIQYWRDTRLPGALNLPHDQVDVLAPSLLPDREAEIIVYCTGTSCPNSGIAAERLAKLGYSRVYTYKAGKEDWVGAGLPTESGE
ncbi:rhodanese-like domain-containing protein [Amycolatopsis samaneae]|uniref:Rhodanese-like domain-containing protein n=1 Tax=Amycolatopsis samaneae TaxID=664691 RepID=A0ABW5GWZ0_9PSEU